MADENNPPISTNVLGGGAGGFVSKNAPDIPGFEVDGDTWSERAVAGANGQIKDRKGHTVGKWFNDGRLEITGDLTLHDGTTALCIGDVVTATYDGPVARKLIVEGLDNSEYGEKIWKQRVTFSYCPSVVLP